MANARRHPTGSAGLRSFGRRRAELEPLPIVGPEGVDPNLWAHVLVADRGRGWMRLIVGEVARAHPKTALHAVGALGGGSGVIVLIFNLLGIG